MTTKEELKNLLEKLSIEQFSKIKQLYNMTNKIKGDTIEEFVSNIPNDKTVQGIINLCNKL